MILTSPLLARLGVRHGFSTRLGGVSSGAQATLDIGPVPSRRPDDEGPGEEDLCRENLQRFAALIGLEASQRIVRVHQVHGARVVGTDDEGAQADGLFSHDRSLAVGVRTADCTPILIAAGDGALVAAVHAGWRGACAGIAEVAVAALEARGADRERMIFALGPSIGFEAFEVGEEVVAAARASLGGDDPPARLGPRGKPHLDLVELIAMQLERLGISSARVDRVGGCTFSNRAMFFSHRRDHGITGRLMSAIAPR